MGFALGNTLIATATPLEQIERKNKKQVNQHIEYLIDEYGIEKIVVGCPYHMDGSKGAMSEEVERFANSLRGRTRLQVELVDERLTSFEAEELLKTHQKDYKKRKKVLDSISALVILKNYMEIT